MQKYWQIFKTSLKQYLVYRLSFVLWRLRLVLSLLLVYFLWSSAFSGRQQIFSYSLAQMSSYVILVHLVGDIVFSSRVGDLAGYIRDGTIMNYLLKPFSIFHIMFSREIVDKIINIFFSVFEILILVLVLKPSLVIQQNPLVYALMFGAVFLGVVISYFIFFSLSSIAFWTPEIWAPRFVFFVLISGLAGGYYPLDIFPKAIYYALLFSPFPYLVYLPAKIYIEGISLSLLPLFTGALFWAMLSIILARAIWRKGLAEYSFFGR